MSFRGSFVRRHAVLCASALCVILIAAAAQAPQAKHTYNFFLGGKWLPELSDDDLPFGLDLKEQPDLGVEMSFGKDDWPVMIAVDILASGADDSRSFSAYIPPYGDLDLEIELENRSIELDVGVRKTWEKAGSRVRPYIGGGLSTIQSEMESTFSAAPLFGASSFEDTGEGLGIWAGGGVYWKVGKKMNLGFNVRRSSARLSFDDLDIDNVHLGGTHVGLLLGWGF